VSVHTVSHHTPWERTLVLLTLTGGWTLESTKIDETPANRKVHSLCPGCFFGASGDVFDRVDRLESDNCNILRKHRFILILPPAHSPLLHEEHFQNFNSVESPEHSQAFLGVTLRSSRVNLHVNVPPSAFLPF
jgi:hypothetical protein